MHSLFFSVLGILHIWESICGLQSKNQEKSLKNWCVLFFWVLEDSTVVASPADQGRKEKIHLPRNPLSGTSQVDFSKYSASFSGLCCSSEVKFQNHWGRPLLYAPDHTVPHCLPELSSFRADLWVIVLNNCLILNRTWKTFTTHSNRSTLAWVSCRYLKFSKIVVTSSWVLLKEGKVKERLRNSWKLFPSISCIDRLSKETKQRV